MVYIYTYQWFTNDVYITVYMIYGIWVSHGFFTYAVYIHGLDTLEEMVWADLSQLNTWDEKWRAKIVGSDGRKMITGGSSHES